MKCSIIRLQQIHREEIEYNSSAMANDTNVCTLGAKEFRIESVSNARERTAKSSYPFSVREAGGGGGNNSNVFSDAMNYLF